MVEQAKYEWRQMSEEVVVLRSGVPGDQRVEAFALKHCERHHSAVATMLRFFKGQLRSIDMIHLSLKKHRDVVSQMVSRSNVLLQDIERQRRQD